MNNLQMLKKAMLAYVSAVKFVWSSIAYPLSIVGKKLMNLRGYRVYGNSVQDGTPTPETPIEIQSVGDLVTDEASEYYGKYDVPVVARGKNLFDGSSSEGNGKYLNSNGVLGSGSDNLRVTDYITIPSGVSSLTFSYKGDVMNYPSICLYDDSKNYITGKSYGGIRNTNISVPSNAKYVRCSYRTVNTDIQLEGSSTKTGYEPYIAPVTTNIFLDKPLRKVGDYADYIDFEKQKVVRNISKYIFTGDENISIRIGEDRAVFYFPQILNKYGNNNKNFIPHGELCNRYQHVENVSINTPLKISLSDCIYICDYYLTAEEYQAQLKNWYSSESPLIMYYALATPTEETVTLPALPQFKGTTIYEVGTNIKPSGMEAKYI